MDELSKTYCPRLWREIFIKEEGDVYVCCHEKPQAIGNIYHSSLAEIINNSQVTKFREDSLKGELGCYKKCNLLTSDEFKNPLTETYLDYNNLKRLKIQFGESCNIKCTMCYQSSNKNNNIALDAGMLIKNLDLSPFESIEIQGGEPLFIPQVVEFFDHAISLRKKVSFLSNGTIMTDEWAGKIAEHSDFFYISLNAASKDVHESINKGSRWEKVLDNISRLKDARQRLNSGLVIKGHFTIIPENLGEIQLFIKNYRELGFDQIDFGYDFKLPFYLKLHPALRNGIRESIAHSFSVCPYKNGININRLKILKLIN